MRSQNSWNFLQNYLIGYLIYSASHFCENDFQLVFSLPKTINRFLGCYATRVTLHCCDGSAFLHSRPRYTWIRNNEPHANLFRPRFDLSFCRGDIHTDCKMMMICKMWNAYKWVNGLEVWDEFPKMFIKLYIVLRTLPELSSVVLNFLLKKEDLPLLGHVLFPKVTD